VETQSKNRPGGGWSIVERLEWARERIAAAAARSGRRAEDVTLVVVTKGHSIGTIRELLELGQEDIGENRAQEMIPKMEGLSARFPDARWHFLGHLQRNKVRNLLHQPSSNQAPAQMELIHSVDSTRLIVELERQAAAAGIQQRILLEINVGGERRKTGAGEADLPRLLEALAASPHLRAQGLMTVPPFGDDPETSRPYFIRLRELMAAIPRSDHFEPRHLSMGMSGDYELAVEEGATMVRVGTAILGERA
jgi:pyridoxal phosphate enzyme (YggS family)